MSGHHKWIRVRCEKMTREELLDTVEHYYDACVKMEGDLIELFAEPTGHDYHPDYGWNIGDHSGMSLAQMFVNMIKFVGHDYCETHEQLGGYCRQNQLKGCRLSAVYRKKWD